MITYHYKVILASCTFNAVRLLSWGHFFSSGGLWSVIYYGKLILVST